MPDGIMIKKVKNNDTVVLVDTSYHKFIIETDGKTDKIKGLGVIDPKNLIGNEYGKQIEIGDRQFWILQPSLLDKLQCLKRQAQIILPRDSAHIIMNCSIESGHNVLEAGIGSGSLTIALANTIAPNGKVISYDKRDDFIEHALKNLKSAKLDKYVITKIKDVTKGIDEKDLDAVILDIPNPWNAVDHAWKALKTGGFLCTYSPLISQVEKTVEEIKKNSFIEVKTFENIQREMIVSDFGTRPSFDMLGHTGYLTFARKVL
jgi:tRNA (adenine57-N1/adenine58-N1)-methyltransferase